MLQYYSSQDWNIKYRNTVTSPASRRPALHSPSTYHITTHSLPDCAILPWSRHPRGAGSATAPGMASKTPCLSLVEVSTYCRKNNPGVLAAIFLGALERGSNGGHIGTARLPGQAKQGPVCPTRFTGSTGVPAWGIGTVLLCDAATPLREGHQEPGYGRKCLVRLGDGKGRSAG